jgi:glycolate oxidase
MEYLNKLEEIVGPEYVSASPDVCRAYAYGCFLGSEWVRMPDVVVMPQSVEQVSQVLKLANEFKVPVTPKGWAAGSGFSGPLFGGILMDLDYMDKIISIDPVNMKAIAEGGCSFFKLSQELFKNGMMLPTTEYSPGPSVAAAAITPVNAFGKTRYDRNNDLVEGFEVVLPTGDICRVGSLAYEHTPFGPFYRFIHGPDLVGLFVMSNGGMGIVTKVAFTCPKKPNFYQASNFYWREDEIEEYTQATLDATSLEVFDVHMNDKWKYVTSDKPEESILPPDADFILSAILTAETREEMDAKQDTLNRMIERHKGKKMGDAVSDTFFGKWPTYHTMSANPLFKKQWDMLYNTCKANYWFIYDSVNYPTSWFPKVYRKLKEIGEKNGIWGFPRMTIFDGFPMKAHTVCSQTWAFINARDKHWLQQIYRCRDEFREWFGPLGGTHQMHFPPILPEYAWSNQQSDHDLVERIKEMLDPNNILNPGAFTSGRRNY